jgi:uncharacterized protein (TIGR02646 family)
VKLIQKGKPPKALTEYAAEPVGTSYADMPEPVKQAIREALAEEQGHLCAYCMSRIHPDAASMKNDHLAAQRPERGASTGGAKLALSYSNMVGVCKGGEGRPYHEQHCDTHKRNTAISVNPIDASSGWERAMFYEEDATPTYEPSYLIHSRHAAHEKDVSQTLNLNVASLGIARWSAIKAVVGRLSRTHPGPWTRAVVEREIRRYEQRDDQGRFAPFCEAIVFYLRKRLARCQR